MIQDGSRETVRKRGESGSTAAQRLFQLQLLGKKAPLPISCWAHFLAPEIIDGEIVAMDESGRPSFSRLQNFSANAHAITFYAFDMPMWKGRRICARSRLRSVVSCCG